MKKRITVLLIAVVLALLTPGETLADAKKTVRLTNGEWQPFMSEEVPHYGFASHIVTEAFANVGIEVEYGFFPWARAYKLSKDGTWDGGAVWWDTEERREFHYFSEAVAPATTVLFHLKDKDFDWKTYEDLGNVRIGATLEYSYGTAFDEAEAAGTIKTNRAPKDETNLKKLLKGRVDVFPGELMVTYAQIRDTFSEEEAARFTHHELPINDQPLHLMLSKKVEGNEDLRNLFNEGLRQLKESGRYDQIIADAVAGKYAKPGS
jgi:polar amino acid transport system substrate-binding protein